ncbi:DksA/TraR family C4-type zinc finger protein [Pantoea osteomyelitidis]|uniref:DksA/TraR family C4-type zinc finger protein n=1 Tax=Pantoea osteomyelitidis TaxID=3230026 RepID=A0ABW7PW68_9GAMM
MASGWASDGAVQEQIDTTVNDEITRVRQSIGQGESAHFCEECGDEIPLARRNALKGVKYCLPCQQERDKKLNSHAIFNRRGSKDSQLR